MLSRLIPVSVIVIVILASVLATVRSWVLAGMDERLNVPEEGYVLKVEPGNSLNQLSRELARKDIIDTPYPLLIYSRVMQLDQIHAGDYLLRPSENPRQLIHKLLTGDVIRFQITFPEGRSLRQWLEIINGHPRFAGQPPLTMADVEAAFQPPAGDSLEGWFFPETYTFYSSDKPLGVLRQAHEKMNEVLLEEWHNKSEGLPLENSYEALILASIIEKETGLADERAAIAGVFTRRLERGMRLQTDPTVIYGLGENFDGNLTRAHLKEDNPYNTYVVSRLPPTPIANPGRDSIHAALHPGKGSAIYFVARGDGSHHFSTTLAEHRKAVRQYQLRRVKDYRSAPE